MTSASATRMLSSVCEWPPREPHTISIRGLATRQSVAAAHEWREPFDVGHAWLRRNVSGEVRELCSRLRIISTSLLPRSGTPSAVAIVMMSPSTSSSVVGLVVTTAWQAALCMQR